jgi:hypothetical protein
MGGIMTGRSIISPGSVSEKLLIILRVSGVGVKEGKSSGG